MKNLSINFDGQKEDILKTCDKLNKKLRIWERKKSGSLENAKKAMAFDKHEKVLFPRTELTQFPRYQQAKRTDVNAAKNILARGLETLF